MSILSQRNETKMMNLGGTHTTCGQSLPNFNIHSWYCGPCFCDCYDIMLLTKGEGPHLLATGRQAMNSVYTNKVVFFQGHMCEY